MSPRTKQQYEEIRKSSKGRIMTVALKLFAEKAAAGRLPKAEKASKKRTAAAAAAAADEDKPKVVSKPSESVPPQP